MPLKEPPDWVREMVKARDDAGQSSTVGIGIDGSILIDGKQIWPRPPVAPGVAALGALVETIICDGLDDMNKVQNYGGECRWQYVDPYNGGSESISATVLHVGWLDDKTDFRNVDFSACQKQEYTYAVGDRYTVTGSPLSMNINVSGGVGRETAKQVAREIQRIVASKEGDKPSNAKPALPAIQTVAGDKYRGLGWCDAY